MNVRQGHKRGIRGSGNVEEELVHKRRKGEEDGDEGEDCSRAAGSLAAVSVLL